MWRTGEEPVGTFLATAEPAHIMVATSWVAGIGEVLALRATPSREQPDCLEATEHVAARQVDPPREELCQLKVLYP